jgi:plasmid stabilization system protein ParE
MSDHQGFALHPLAAQDITEIWEYIAEDSPLAASRVREELLNGIRALVAFPNQGYRRPNLTSRPLRFKLVREYVIATRRRKSRCGLWLCSTGGAAPA